MATSDSDSSKQPLRFGRGGAGNVTAKDPKSPSVVAVTTPTLKADHYTTGRGGTGNMAKLDPDRPEEARAAQDLDIPGILLSEGPQLTGRGGAANIHNPTEDEISKARAHNEQLRRNSIRRGNSGVLKGLAEKGKDLFRSKDEKDSAIE